MQKSRRLIKLLTALEDLDVACKSGEVTKEDMPKMRAVLEAYTSWQLSYNLVQWLEETIDARTLPTLPSEDVSEEA